MSVEIVRPCFFSNSEILLFSSLSPLQIPVLLSKEQLTSKIKTKKKINFFFFIHLKLSQVEIQRDYKDLGVNYLW